MRRQVHRPLESPQRPFFKEARDSTPQTLMQSQMYTPEALKSEGLSVNCHRMVQYGLSMPDLLDRYGARAAELASGMTPLQFSLLLSSFARAEHRHEAMIKAFSKYMPPKLPSFLPMQLSQVCNSYAKLRERDEALFRRFSSEMPHKLPLFEGFHLQHVVNAYAKLTIRDDLLFDDVADEVVRRPEELDAAGLVLVANAFGRFKIKHPQLWPTLAEWLLHSCLDLRPVDVAVVLNAFSAVGYRHDGLVAALLQHITEPMTLGEIQAGSGVLGLSLNALARFRWEDERHILALASRILEIAGDLDMAGVTQLLHACTRLPALSAHAELVGCLLKQARSLVPDASAQSLSLLVHACAALQQRDVELLTLVAKAVPPKIGDFTPQALAMTATGFARLEVRSEILFYLLAGEVVEKMPLFSGKGVGMVLRAFGRMRIKNERLLQSCRKQLRTLFDELTLAELESIEAGFKSLDALDGVTEALVRRLRRQLASAESDASGAAPFQAYSANDSAGDLLRRMAEEAPQHARREDSPANASEARGVQPAVSSERHAPHEERPRSEGQPDLWDMWAGGGEEEEKATSPSALRQYLERPERASGRKAVVTLLGNAEGRIASERGARTPGDDGSAPDAWLDASPLGRDGDGENEGGEVSNDKAAGGRKRFRRDRGRS